MSGYLGKVSALVTVNTSDIASKVQSGFAAPFEKALRQIENTLRNANRAAERSFGDIYTASQKVERALAAAAMGAVKGFGSDATAAFRNAQVAADQIAEPIRAAANAIEQMSGSVRSSLEPALVAAQAEAQSLFDMMKTDANAAAANIDRVVGLVRELNELVERAPMQNRWAALSQIGMGEQGQQFRREQSGRDAMAAGIYRAGAPGRERIAAAEREAAAQESRIWAIRDAEQRAAEQRQLATARQIHEEEQRAIEAQRQARAEEERQVRETAAEEMRARERIRQQIEDEFAERQRMTAQAIYDEEQAAISAERRAREVEEARRVALEEASSRSRDAAERAMADDENRVREEAARFSGRVATERASSTAEFRDSFGGRGATGIGLGLDRNALAASTAELQIIQRAIGRASAEARGPAVEAFIRLRNAIADAFESGTLETEAARRSIAALRQEAVNTAAQVGGVGRRALTRDVQRAGDISRGGADKFGLALQQAGFAIDDFFSATGGLDMKIRAVSNNISQMAFILGGTAGLFTGLAFTIGSQLVVAMMKWADAGRTSADRTKALNDALSRQHSLVGDLADSYKELAKSMAAASSPQAQKAAGQEAMLQDVASKRRAAMEESIYAADTGVASARASVTMEERLSLASVSVEQQQAAQFRIMLAKRREEEAKREALARNAQFNAFVGNGPAAGLSVQAGIQVAMERFGNIRMDSMDEADRRQFERVLQAQMAAVPAAADRAGAVTQLRSFIEGELENNDLTRNPGVIVTSIMGDLMEQLARLEFGLKEANAAIINDVSRSLVGTSNVLEEAQKSISGAAMETQDITAIRTQIDQAAASLEALSTAAAETTDRDVLNAIAQDAAAAEAFAEQVNAAAKKARDFADQLAKAIAEERAAADRGFELGRVRDEMGKVNDIRAQAAVIGNDADRVAFVNRAFRNVREDTLGVMRGFEQERQNAILGGPSRQALNASDASTTDGQRELNRLLRGDDPSRDANFAEMKHQSDLLQQIADGIKAATGVVVDFR